MSPLSSQDLRVFNTGSPASLTSTVSADFSGRKDEFSHRRCGMHGPTDIRCSLTRSPQICLDPRNNPRESASSTIRCFFVNRRNSVGSAWFAHIRHDDADCPLPGTYPSPLVREPPAVRPPNILLFVHLRLPVMTQAPGPFTYFGLGPLLAANVDVSFPGHGVPHLDHCGKASYATWTITWATGTSSTLSMRPIYGNRFARQHHDQEMMMMMTQIRHRCLFRNVAHAQKKQPPYNSLQPTKLVKKGMDEGSTR